MTICSLGKSKSKNIKPIFVIKLSKTAKPEDIIRTSEHATSTLLGKEYHILVVKSKNNTDIEFELYNIKDINTTDFESFKEEIKSLLNK